MIINFKNQKIFKLNEQCHFQLRQKSLIFEKSNEGYLFNHIVHDNFHSKFPKLAVDD